MAAYALEALLHRWALHQLTSEQAIGQILLVLHEWEPRLIRLEQTAVTPTVAPLPAAPQASSVEISKGTTPRKRQIRRRAG